MRILRMKVCQTELSEVLLIDPTLFEDDRGWFMESFNEVKFHKALHDLGCPPPRAFIQDNHSCSKKGVLRGLHYQLDPHAQGKLVSVSRGAAFDVAVDIRKGSATFGRWVSAILSAENKKMLWIPEGFAHGFLALEDETHFHYKTTDSYNKDFERAIRWDDPEIGIDWPDIEHLIVSEKDCAAPLLVAADLPSNFHQGSLELVDLKVIGDDRGSLIALEQGQNIPFGLRRAYYIFDTRTDVSRGFHAHRRLEQMAVCVSGKCRMILDDGFKKESVWLDAPDKAVIIRNMIWREMHDFSDDCVLVVFASEHYDESDYIRSYDAFLREVIYAKV